MLKFPSLGRMRPRSGYDVLALIGVFVALGSGGAHAANMIGSADVIDDSLLSQDVKNGTLTAADLAASAIAGDRVADGSLGGADIEDRSLFAEDIGWSTIQSSNIAPGAVMNDDVADGAITGRAVQNGSLTGDDVLANSIGGSRITDGSIGSADVADNYLTGADINESSLGKVPTAAKADAAGDAYVATGGWSWLWKDGTWRTYASLDLTAGNYAVTAKLMAGLYNNVMTAECRLRLGSSTLDVTFDNVEEDEEHMTLVGIGSLSAPAKALVECRQTGYQDADGFVSDLKIMAVKVATVH